MKYIALTLLVLPLLSPATAFALENLRFYASDLAHPTFVEHIEDGMVQPPSMEEVLDGPKLRIEMVQPDGETLVYGRFDDPPAAGLVDFGGGPPAP